MRNSTMTIAATTILSMGAALAAAQSPQGAQSGTDHSAMPGMKGDRSMMAMDDYKAAMKKMDQAMMAAQGSTPDAVFARKMIAHHQGAIDMAQIQLKQGSDADAKRIAQKTIEENTKGMAELQDWLKAHGG